MVTGNKTSHIQPVVINRYCFDRLRGLILPYRRGAGYVLAIGPPAVVKRGA